MIWNIITFIINLGGFDTRPDKVRKLFWQLVIVLPIMYGLMWVASWVIYGIFCLLGVE